jgi:cytochrome P450
MPNVNLLSPAFRQNPYPAYKQLLNDTDDVSVVEMGAQRGEWVSLIVTKYEHVAALLRDPRMVLEFKHEHHGEKWTPPESWQPYFDMTRNWMLFRDPPAHTRLRGLVNKAFTPQAVNRLRNHIENIANALLDEVEAKDAFDLVADYAFELPVRVIAEMLGVPTARRADFKAWSNTLADAIDFSDKDGSVIERAAHAAQAMTAFMRELIAAKRTHPTDDILTGLVQAEQGGDHLSEDEVISTCGLLLFAGHETTVNLIGNGALTLLRHPQQLALLQRDPTLLPNAVEEILRYESPVQATSRTAATEITIGNSVIPKGRGITLIMAAANRDPRQFESPEQFDITRTDAAKHLTFGGGIHYCVGAPLARMEGQIGLGTLFRRMPNLQLETDAQHWRDLMVLRGLTTLPVRTGTTMPVQ